MSVQPISMYDSPSTGSIGSNITPIITNPPVYTDPYRPPSTGGGNTVVTPPSTGGGNTVVTPPSTGGGNTVTPPSAGGSNDTSNILYSIDPSGQLTEALPSAKSVNKGSMKEVLLYVCIVALVGTATYFFITR